MCAFTGIFHDENGVYSEDAQGNAVYNWSYVDQIYDGLLANGVRPFVEIGFMPKALAAQLDYHAFWYKPIVSPPKDYAKWDALDRCVCAASYRPLRNRRGFAVVLRGVERTQSRLLGGKPPKQPPILNSTTTPRAR